jgi:hypothetical protein
MLIRELHYYLVTGPEGDDFRLPGTAVRLGFAVKFPWEENICPYEGGLISCEGKFFP